MRRVAVLPVTGVHLEGVIERGQKPQRKKLWMKRSTIACDRLTPYAFVHRVFRFSSRKSIFFAKLFNALSFSFFVTSLQPWFFLLSFPFFNFLRKSIEIEKWMFVANTQTANSIGFFDKRRQNFLTFHDGFSTQVSRYTRTTYFSFSFSLFQVYMYVFLLSISFERKKNIGYKTNERIYNIDKKEENEEKGIYFSPNLVIKEELCNSYDTRIRVILRGIRCIVNRATVNIFFEIDTIFEGTKRFDLLISYFHAYRVLILPTKVTKHSNEFERIVGTIEEKTNRFVFHFYFWFNKRNKFFYVNMF